MKKICALIVSMVILSILFTNPVLADDIDNLLNKADIAPNPVPNVMVSGYELSPEALMPGDIGILTVTLENTQKKPIEKEIDLENDAAEIDTETHFTMDAYIEEAYIVERDFKVYNRYIAAGVVGPGKKVDLPFKIKAPIQEGLYMLKFIVDVEDTQGRSGRGIRYYIPVNVGGTVKITLLEVLQDKVELEVVNDGLGDVDSVYAILCNSTGVEFQKGSVYIGEMKSGESVIVRFNISELDEGAEATFKAVYRNGINKHESEFVYVNIPFKEGEKGGEKNGNSTTKLINNSTMPSSFKGTTKSIEMPCFEVIFPILSLTMVYLLLKRRGLRR